MTDPINLAHEFPLDADLVYLNHAAVAPWPRCAAEAASRFAEENIHRGASRYPLWLEKEHELRGQLRRLINARCTDEIALLKNTSEALSVVACGLDWNTGDNVVSSDQEFPSNRIPWQAQLVHGVEFREICLETDDPEAALMNACDQRTRILTISSVQYASGLRLDLERLGTFCRDQGILFCIDAIQSLGAIQLDAQSIKADFIMADAHKWMLGPEGIALFYCREEVRDRLTLHQYGWHMTDNPGDYDSKTWQPAGSSRRFECGSANMLGIHVFSASLALLAEFGYGKVESAVLDNSTYLIERISQVDDLELITPAGTARRAGIVSFGVRARDSAVIQQKLVEKGVICACRGGWIRFSPHFYTPRSSIDKALEILSSSI